MSELQEGFEKISLAVIKASRERIVSYWEGDNFRNNEFLRGIFNDLDKEEWDLSRISAKPLKRAIGLCQIAICDLAARNIKP